MSQIRRGEIYWANLDPTIGSEISKTRPVLIVSNNINNRYAATVSILPITSTTSKVYPFEVFLPKSEGNLSNDSKAKANQIRTLDKQRIGKKIGDQRRKTGRDRSGGSESPGDRTIRMVRINGLPGK